MTMPSQIELDALPTDVDATNLDSDRDPTVRDHQRIHDLLHGAVKALRGTFLGSADAPKVIRDTIGAALKGTAPVGTTYNATAGTITVTSTATQNRPDAELLARANHTGAQPLDTVTGLQAALDLRQPLLLASGEATMGREFVNSSVLTSASGSVRLSFFTAARTEQITRVRAVSGDTAAGATPTLARIGVYRLEPDKSATLVASTANDTTLFAAANTRYIRALTAGFTKQAGVRYALATIVVTTATAPTLVGNVIRLVADNGNELVEEPVLSLVLTGMTDLPATVTAADVASKFSGSKVYGALLP